ncbi:MAG: amidohydrolase family protein, partial [Planctomycetes bacterium]|nr:amidohydrolase family protein [Planctomycetota bacterium]
MRALKLCSILSLSALAVGLSSPTLFGQSAPPNGMRAADLRTHAIVDARVVIRPGVVLERATIVIKDGVIIEVGENVQPPRDAQIWSGEGLTVYPGLIEPALLIKPGEREESPGTHWNMHIHPEIDMIDQPSPDEELRKEMRSMGFTAAAVYPDSGIWRGTGTVIALADSDEHALSYLDRTAMAAGFSTTRGFGRGNYPGSLMGAIALMRQTLLDAQWHATSRNIWEQYPEGNEPPIRADALDAMVPVLGRQQTVLFDVSDELNALRAHRVGTEFNLDMTLLGSGLEFRRLDEIVATNRVIIVPLNYPKTPEVTSVSEADRASLRDLMTWEQAPTNPRRLIQAGITVALTTHRLEKRKDFFKNLRLAIKHGLSEDDALASLTTTPATMLGLEKVLGTVESGKAANLVVVEGGLFDKDAKIRDTWINGRRHEISTKPLIELKGKYAFWTSHGHTSQADIDTEKKSVTFDLADDKELKAKKVVVKKDLITIVVSGEALETDGYVQLSGVVTGDSITGNGIMPDGDRFQFTFTPTPDAIDDEQSEDDTDEAKDDDKSDEVIGGLPPEELVMPLGAYGVDASPTSQKIYVRGATIWTEGPEGIIEDGCLIIAGGKTVALGKTEIVA